VIPDKLLLAAPRGYCAGVDRAVQTVEHALDLHGPPVYVRKEIVHNKHVVASLRDRGAIFVDELDDSIPEGAITVFSAHGVSPAVHADAERRGLQTIDATCPLVTKVHREAVKFAGEGYTARSSRTSPGRAPTTSATRPPTARRRSSRWPRSVISCSSSARPTRRTRSVWSTWRVTAAPAPT
jgi:hypothetical protein